MITNRQTISKVYTTSNPTAEVLQSGCMLIGLLK